MRVSTVRLDRNNSARHGETRPTAGATSPETNLNSSEPNTTKTVAIIRFRAVNKQSGLCGKTQPH